MFGIGETVFLRDLLGRDIGSVLVREVTPYWVLGDFTPGAQFGEVEALFAEFEQMVNDQLIALLDPVMDQMEALGIRLPDGNLLRDVQIYPAEGGANWRPVGYVG